MAIADKRQAFRSYLKTKPAGAMVYVDEAGIDNRIGLPNMATVRLDNASTPLNRVNVLNASVGLPHSSKAICLRR